MSEQYNKLKKTLQTIFEMDKADLDFGIYRIINQKRDEINQFLENDLLPQVTEAFADFAAGGKTEVEAELQQLIKTLTDAGMDPKQSPKVKELQEKMKSSVDITAVENDVYSHLHTFFSRYYDKGDFISQRRYKSDAYAIPYEGEEVKLYWANQDQYYIKSSEHLRDYAFTVTTSDSSASVPNNADTSAIPGGRKDVRIHLVEADTEKDNIKAKSDEERRFVLDGDNPLAVTDGELTIRFQYIPVGKKKQEKLNSDAVKTIFEQEGFDEWLDLLKQKAPTEKNPDRTLLEKHLNDYTARNTFDYFIHKDLGAFLRRELDFYIKNEVFHLDDIDDAAFEVTDQHLRKIKVIRTIAHKLIRMLAQLEDFQKKLWLKKKFVVETNYCITLDRVPVELYGQIAGCSEQHIEWLGLGFITEDVGITEDYLKENPYLVLDTKFFDDGFKTNLLASIENFDKQCDGLLVNGDNFQALSLLNTKHQNTVKCIYIDPPYNAKSSEILYKNTFKHSSWLSLMDSRIYTGKKLLSDTGVHITAIDEVEQEVLGRLLSQHFPEHEKSCIAVVHNPSGQQGDNFTYMHEYAYFIYPKPGRYIALQTREDDVDVRNFRDVTGDDSLRNSGPNCFYPIFINEEGEIQSFGDICDPSYHPDSINVVQDDGTIAIYPIDPEGIERKWRFARNTVEQIKNELHAHYIGNRQVWDIKRTKNRFNFKTVWSDSKYSANNHGTQVLNHILGRGKFSYPKSIHTVTDSIIAATNETNSATILDYFAGSGTTAHAVINLNRKGATHKYINIEQGQYFKSALVPRIKKVLFSSSWRNEKPTAEDGISHCFKYHTLESYEDTLNNLVFKERTGQQQNLLESNAELREDYMLGYWLDVETAESGSLLNIEQFEDPFNYKLNIATGSVGATRPTRIDLVETFNYLLGLTVKHIDTLRGFRVVTGSNPKDETVLVVWRNVKEQDNAALEDFLDKSGYNPKDTEYDHIYVNGDHTLEDPHSKVKMIEIEFKRLMFDVQDA